MEDTEKKIFRKPSKLFVSWVSKNPERRRVNTTLKARKTVITLKFTEGPELELSW